MEGTMSCDLIFNDGDSTIVASAGTWAAISKKDQRISVTFPYAPVYTGVASTTIDIPMATFLIYKKFCEQQHIDADLTRANLPNIIANYSPRQPSISHQHNYDSLSHK